MNGRSSTARATPSASTAWGDARMRPGFEALGRLTFDAEDLRQARDRYDGFRPQIDPVIYDSERVELALAATRVHRSGKQVDALVVITDSMVVVCSAHRGIVGARPITDIFPRAELEVLASLIGRTHTVDLYEDGRRLRLVLPRPNAALERALVAYGMPVPI